MSPRDQSVESGSFCITQGRVWGETTTQAQKSARLQLSCTFSKRPQPNVLFFFAVKSGNRRQQGFCGARGVGFPCGERKPQHVPKRLERCAARSDGTEASGGTYEEDRVTRDSASLAAPAEASETASSAAPPPSSTCSETPSD